MNKETHILFTGDSITDGNRCKDPDRAWDLNHQIGHSFVYVINALLGSFYPERCFRFTNRGISGNKIIDVYSRLDMDLIRLQPEIVSFLVGINDGPGRSNDFRASSPQKFSRLYRMMLDEILERLPEVRLVICEPFVLDNPRLEPEFSLWDKSIRSFQEECRKLAEDYHAVFVAIQDEFDRACQLRESSYWSWDGIHPTENGHGLIARRWLSCVADLLEISGKLSLE